MNNEQLEEEEKTAIFSRNRPFSFFQKLIDAVGIVLMSAVMAIIIRKSLFSEFRKKLQLSWKNKNNPIHSVAVLSVMPSFG